MGVVGQIDGNVHDAISYSDKKAASNAADAIDDMISRMNNYMTSIGATIQTDDVRQYYNQVKTYWNTYYQLAQELMSEGTAAWCSASSSDVESASRSAIP